MPTFDGGVSKKERAPDTRLPLVASIFLKSILFVVVAGKGYEGASRVLDYRDELASLWQ